MKKVDGTGHTGTVPWYFTKINSFSSILHLGSGQLPSSTSAAQRSPLADIAFANGAGLLAEIDLDGSVKAPANASFLFGGLVNLTTINGLQNLDTSATTNMDNLFYTDFLLKSGLENITNWDTSHVTSMNETFSGINLNTDIAEATTVLNLSGWDTRKVTNFTKMFSDSKFKQITFGPNFKTAQAGADGVTLPNSSPGNQWLHYPTLSTDRSVDAYKDSLPYGTYIQGLAADATMTYQTTGNVVVKTDKIYGANGSPLFYNPIDPWTTSNLTAFPYVYVDQTSGAYVDTPDTLVGTYKAAPDNSDDHSFYVMPVQAKGIIGTGATATKWYLTSDGTLTILGGTLSNAPGATTNPWAAAQTTAGKSVAQAAKKVVFSQPTTLGANATYLFADLPNVTDFTNLNQLNTAAATDMTGMFKNDPKLNTLDASAMNLGKVTSMKDMFNGDTALKSVTQPATGLVPASVKDISGIFKGASALTTLDVTKWQTQNVTAMTDAFNGASGLSKLDISGWTTDKLTAFDGAFANMPKLTTLSFGTATNGAWKTSGFSPQTSLANLLKGDTGLTSVTFSPGFSAASGINVQLPNTAKKLWLRTDGVALPGDLYTTAASSAGTYQLTTATYTVTLVDDKSDKTLQTITSDPIESNDIGHPIILTDLLNGWPGYVPIDDTGPITATKFTMNNGVGTQAITVHVRQVGGPDQFPLAGRDSRLLMLVAGTTIALAGLVGMLIFTNKKRS
jgi:surface protein